MIEKCEFLKVVKIPCSKNRFLVTLVSFLSTCNFLPGRGWLSPVSTVQKEFFNEKKSSLACLKKSYSLFRKSTDFGHFYYLGPPSKSNISMYKQKLEKSSVSFQGNLLRTLC